MLLKKGMRSEDIRKLQGGLALLGYKPGTPDGIFGANTESAVEAFQLDHGLYADSIAGLLTLREYNRKMTERGSAGKPFLISLPQAAEPVSSPQLSSLKWVKCDADVVPGRDGFNSTTLREDAAASFNELRAAAKSLGGVVTSAGGRRMLDTSAGANQSRTSLHYLGRAHDLSLETGMKNLDTDSYIITRPDPESRHWRVFCRSSLSVEQLKRNPLGIPAGEFTVDAWYVASKKDAAGKTIRQPATQKVTFKGFDFTALAAKFGWEPIPARAAFFSRGDILAAEWWHWSYTTGLEPGRLFGSELLRVYPLDQAKKFVYWEQVKDAKYGSDWS